MAAEKKGRKGGREGRRGEEEKGEGEGRGRRCRSFHRSWMKFPAQLLRALAV